MSRIDHLDLDGHALALLLAVHEEGSVTRAAQRLGLTQSAVSHGLDRLRVITGDPLFVRAGRGIVATVPADALALRARVLLDELRAFSQAAGFEPARWQGTITLAANDLQRDLLVPPLLRRLRAECPGARLRIWSSNAPRAELLREQGCDLLVTPRPPEAADLVQTRLFAAHHVISPDAAGRAAPAGRADYLAAQHVSVRYEDGRGLDVDDWLAAQGLAREVVVTVPGFAGVAALLRGSELLATGPSLLARGVLHDLAIAPLPVAPPPMPMYLVWHLRRQQDPAHRWLRGLLQAIAREALTAPPVAAVAQPRRR